MRMLANENLVEKGRNLSENVIDRKFFAPRYFADKSQLPFLHVF